MATQLQALQQLEAAQTQRAQLYAKFHNGFQVMCATGSEGPYLRLMQSLTIDFNKISQQVVEVGKELRDRHARPDLAQIVQDIQVAERDKLRATLAMQALRKAHAFGTFSWQNDTLDEHTDAADDPGLLRSLASTTISEADNSAAGHGHRCGAHGHAPGPEAPELSKAEWQAACAEATAELQRTVTSINEALEEVRYEIAELAGTES